MSIDPRRPLALERIMRTPFTKWRSVVPMPSMIETTRAIVMTWLLGAGEHDLRQRWRSFRGRRARFSAVITSYHQQRIEMLMNATTITKSRLAAGRQ